MQKEQIAALQTVLLDHLAEGVCLLTHDGRVLYMNPAAQEALLLAGPVDHVDEFTASFVSANDWQELLHAAPTTVSATTPGGKLRLQSHLQTVDDTPLVQVIIRLERATPVDELAAGEQLTALARISRELNATLLLEDVLAAVLDEALLNTGADSGEISLYDEEGKLINSWQRGEVVAVPQMDRQAIQRRRAIPVAELGDNGDWLGYRSVLVTPVLYGDAVAGLIRLFSAEPAFFDRTTETFVSALANHAATAIGNARRFQEIQERNVLLQQRTQQLERFVESGRVFSGDRPLVDVYEDLVYAIQEGVGYNAVLLSLAEHEGGQYYLRPETGAGLTLDRLQRLQRERYPWKVVEALAQPDRALGGAFLVPAGEATGTPARTAFQLVDERLPGPDEIVEDEHLWQVGDLFFIPMRDQQGKPLGVISLAAPRDGRRPDLNTARVLEIFANQTANAIENVQLFHAMRDYAIELQQLHNVAQQVMREPDFGEKLQYIVDGLQISGWDRVALTLRNEDYEATKLVTSGLSAEEEAHLWAHMMPAAAWRRLLEDPGFQRFRRGSSFFIPADARDALDTGVYGLTDTSRTQLYAGAWHPEDVLIRPLYDGEGKIVGLFTLDQPADGRRPEERALQTIDLYAQLAISVLENIRLFNDIDRHRRELQTLFDASNALSGTLDSQQILRAIGEHLQRAAGAAEYAIYAVDESGATRRLLAEPAEGMGVADERRAHLLRKVIATQEPALLRAGAEGETEETVAVLPLHIRDRLYGLVELVRREQTGPAARGVLAEETLPLLGAILNQGGVALEIAHLFEELDERVAARTAALAAESERVKILLRIATELSSSLDRDVVLNLALQLVNEIVHAEEGAILLVDAERDELVIQAALGAEEPVPVGGVPSGLRPTDGLAGWIIQNRAAVVVDDVTADERWVSTGADANRHSALGVPLIAGDEVLGAMLLTDSRVGRFTPEQLSLVEAAGIQAAGAIQNANLYDLIRQQAERLGMMMREAQIEVAKQQSMLESIADGVLVAEASGAIVMANLPTARILGIPRAELMGKSVDDLYGAYGEAGDAWVRTLKSWADEPQALGPQSFFRDRMETNGQVISIHASPVFANNRYFGAIAIFRDITKEAEIDRMKSEFVSTVSHELRTPMTSIKGYADLILMGVAGPLNASQRPLLDVIKKNADRLQLLVNDLLDISRIETGKTKLSRQPLAMAPLIESVVNEHLRGRLQHEGKDIAVFTDIEPSLPLADADAEKVTRVLTNLIDNAVNYTPAGGQIHVRAWGNDRFVYVSVRDTGIGIAREDQERIFERFYRVEHDAVHAVPGTGLGLSIVKSLVDMHGGEMALDSQPGKGSTFTFSLPAVPGKV